MDTLNTNVFLSLTDEEVEATNGGSVIAGVALGFTIVNVCIGGYNLVRQMVKDKGKADAINGK